MRVSRRARLLLPLLSYTYGIIPGNPAAEEIMPVEIDIHAIRRWALVLLFFFFRPHLMFLPLIFCTTQIRGRTAGSPPPSPLRDLPHYLTLEFRSLKVSE